jgi:hypothetical protein
MKNSHYFVCDDRHGRGALAVETGFFWRCPHCGAALGSWFPIQNFRFPLQNRGLSSDFVKQILSEIPEEVRTFLEKMSRHPMRCDICLQHTANRVRVFFLTDRFRDRATRAGYISKAGTIPNEYHCFPFPFPMCPECARLPDLVERAEHALGEYLEGKRDIWVAPPE